MFIYDSGETVFVWVGSNASPAEKKNGLPVAHVSMLVGWPFCVCYICLCEWYVCISGCPCMCVRACMRACVCETCLPFCV